MLKDNGSLNKLERRADNELEKWERTQLKNLVFQMSRIDF